MKIILAVWGSIIEYKLERCLVDMGYEVIPYDRECRHYTKDMDYALGLMKLINSNEVCGVISCNYLPMISMVCKSCGISYYSWVYDCPHFTLFAAPVLEACNRIGCFDGELTQKLQALGAKGVFHLPLGAWQDDGAVSGGAVSTYDCDVSFVGTLYTNEYNYYESLSGDPGLKKAADELINKQIFCYGKDYLETFFDNDKSPDASNALRERAYDLIYGENLWPGDEYFIPKDDIFISSFLEKKVTIEERRLLLEAIGEKKIDLRLYTTSDTSDNPALERINMGPVDYRLKMPRVFKNSRINLNITLRSIHSGIPLRAVDILADGGFLLSNYQKELAERFEENKELAFYYSIEDCLEKINYYLEHEEERQRIAEAGQKAVYERLLFKKQLETLMWRK